MARHAIRGTSEPFVYTVGILHDRRNKEKVYYLWVHDTPKGRLHYLLACQMYPDPTALAAAGAAARATAGAAAGAAARAAAGAAAGAQDPGDIWILVRGPPLEGAGMVQFMTCMPHAPHLITIQRIKTWIFLLRNVFVSAKPSYLPSLKGCPKCTIQLKRSNQHIFTVLAGGGPGLDLANALGLVRQNADARGLGLGPVDAQGSYNDIHVVFG